MILSTNAFNWAMLRSGMNMGDFIASLTLEREEELHKQYNEWRKARGLAEDTILSSPPTSAVPTAPKRELPPEDDLSALISQVADEVEAEKAAEAELIHNAYVGADGIIEEEVAPTPDEIVEEMEEPAPDREISMPMDTVSPESSTTLSQKDAVEAASEGAGPGADFTAILRTLPKEPDPALYERIAAQFGRETVRAALESELAHRKRRHKAFTPVLKYLEWMGER